MMDEKPEELNEDDKKMKFYKDTIEDFREMIQTFDTERERGMRDLEAVYSATKGVPSLWSKLFKIDYHKMLPSGDHPLTNATEEKEV